MGPLTFETSEHAYQFRACEEHLRPDIAEQVFKAKTPREVKPNLVSFCGYLLESDNKVLVEATSDMYGGSGLS